MSLFDTIRRIVQEELGRVRTAELAIVQEQHPYSGEGSEENYACTVRLRDSGIVLRKVPVSTQMIGMASIPAIDDLVLVHFLGADLNAPIITGRLYNDQDRPPAHEDGQLVLHLPPGADPQEALQLKIQSGEKLEVQLTLGERLHLVMRDDDPVVELSVADGKAMLQIDADGATTLQSQGALTLKSGTIALEGDSIAIEAAGELKLKGGTVNIN